MHSIDWLQLAVYVGALALITKPMGLYLVQVLDANGRTWLDPVIKPFERLTYRIMGVGAGQGAGLEGIYHRHAAVQPGELPLHLCDSAAAAYLPLNPQHFGAMSADLAFNTAVSFTTNTNWQSYGGESTHVLSLADGGAGDPQLRLGRGGHRALPPRWCAGIAAAFRADDRQFLGGPGAHRPITCCCPFAWCLPCSWCRRA